MQIEKQKEQFIERTCDGEPATEITRQQAEVAPYSNEKYVFIHIRCSFKGGNAFHSDALALIFNDQAILRGREFSSVLGGDGKYTLETGKLSYSAPFSAEGDLRCCPTGVGLVVFDARKLEMVFMKVKPWGGEMRLHSNDVNLASTSAATGGHARTGGRGAGDAVAVLLSETSREKSRRYCKIRR